MQTFNKPNEFINGLKNSRRVIFDNGQFKAEITIENPKTIHRQYAIKYFERIGEKWVAFSTCVSSFLTDIIQDANYEFKTLKIN